MRRDIKFRGKRLDNGELIYGTYITGGHDRHFIGYDPTIVTVKDDLISGFKIIGVDPETVGQYIGIEDKNGEEIYEGMDVEYYNGSNKFVGMRHAIVEFIGGCFCILSPYETGDEKGVGHFKRQRHTWRKGIWYDQYRFDVIHQGNGNDGYDWYPLNELVEIIHDSKEVTE